MSNLSDHLIDQSWIPVKAAISAHAENIARSQTMAELIKLSFNNILNAVSTFPIAIGITKEAFLHECTKLFVLNLIMKRGIIPDGDSDEKDMWTQVLSTSNRQMNYVSAQNTMPHLFHRMEKLAGKELGSEEFVDRVKSLRKILGEEVALFTKSLKTKTKSMWDTGSMEKIRRIGVEAVKMNAKKEAAEAAEEAAKKQAEEEAAKVQAAKIRRNFEKDTLIYSTKLRTYFFKNISHYFLGKNKLRRRCLY
jgi:hypothetical protein